MRDGQAQKVTGTFISKIRDFGEVAERQHTTYGSAFVRAIIEKNGLYASPETGVTYQIPTHFGFCYGVEKSIDMAFETRKRFPEKRMYLTHDVIHNPKVNEDLKEKGVTVLERDERDDLILNPVRPEDVVVISAFGTRFQDVEALKRKGCIVVDTTCGAIVLVWKRVEKYATNGFTTIIHGVWDHEETRATASQAIRFGGHFLVIRNMADTRRIAQFLKKEMDPDAFMTLFHDRVSPGFDPVRDLGRIGVASQTTMLKNETVEIQEYLKRIYKEVFGEERFNDVFMIYDTICSATQERQDALYELLATRHDLMLIIGGFNSSNTTHLSEIASERYPTYHIRGPQDLLSPSEIRHLDPLTLEVKHTADWIPSPLKHVGITTGASTPDLMIENVIRRVDSLIK